MLSWRYTSYWDIGWCTSLLCRVLSVWEFFISCCLHIYPLLCSAYISIQTLIQLNVNILAVMSRNCFICQIHGSRCRIIHFNTILSISDQLNVLVPIQSTNPPSPLLYVISLFWNFLMWHPLCCKITGDGENCTPRANLSTELQEMYVTAGPGLLACSEGADVEYPQGAPGFEHDPTGSRGMEVCCHRHSMIYYCQGLVYLKV